ncbi:MAG: hypothetical protein JXN61_08800 [Sedimentisphaerales bacterium]|nr:hypothetical protein [Sedimentisphaerales bacterium]
MAAAETDQVGAYKVAGDTLLPGESLVYYDYIEDGRLKGGVVTTVLPPPVKYRSAEPPPWAVETIIDNGQSENRIDIVFIGDGYTADQLDLYAAHVENAVAGLFSQQPLAAYAGYFNVHRVDVISSESGVDEPASGIYRDTALDMAYDCGGIARLLCINYSKAQDAAGSAPQVDTIIALANSTRYGGAGYSGLATAAGANSSAVELVLHEYGHSFAHLADEYDSGGTTTYTGPEPGQPNVSIYTAAEQLAQQTKWYRWLDLPNVDTFEGALHSRYGIYRPTSNSKMRSLGRPFEEVNAEQFIFAFYEYVRPIDDATPQPSRSLTAGVILFIDPVEPTEQPLTIQWSVDGNDVADANGPTFDTSSLFLGLHDVAVTVLDDTARVRDEEARAERLTETRQWQVISQTDLTSDCFANFLDLAVFAEQWADLDFIDFRSLAQQWLQCQCAPCQWHLPPTLTIIYPRYGQTFDISHTQSIEIIAEAAVAYGSIVKVEFFVNDTLIGEDTDGNDGWSCPWTALAPGQFALTATAVDDLAAETTSDEILIRLFKP